MQTAIQPKYNEITATCSCGESFVVNSTRDQDLQLDVCSSCHPFYTGKQKIVDTGGRISRFERQFRRTRSTVADSSGNKKTED